MRVLVISSGGKAHALLWKLSQNEEISGLFCTFKNAETVNLAEYVDIRETDKEGLVEFVKENKIDLTIIDSLNCALTGLGNTLREQGFNVFGPDQNSCKIEANKGFAKKFFHKYKVPTPLFGVFDKESQAIDHARKSKYPLVVKYDARIPGMGTIICENFNQARNAINFCLKNLYKPIVLEEFIKGKEVSYHVITDGYDAQPLPNCYVYKKSETNNAGYSTEGMGAYSPVSYVTESMEAKIAQKIFFPLIDGLNNEKMAFSGLLSANIIIDEKNNPYLLGINTSFGDPAAQTVLPLLEEDILKLFYMCSIGALGDSYETLMINNDHSVCVAVTTKDYPSEGTAKGEVIEGLEDIDEDNTRVFHGHTAKNIYQEVVTAGGKVLSIVSTASTLHRAHDKVYEAVDMVSFNGAKYRSDIGRYRVFEELKDI